MISRRPSRLALAALVVLLGGLVTPPAVADAAPYTLLRPVGCVAYAIGNPCQFATGVRGANSVAVSPDGLYVYATGAKFGTVAVLKRNANTGALTTLDCVTGLGASPNIPLCGVTGVPGLKDPRGLVVSPNNKHIYVVTGSTVVTLSRNPSTGRLNKTGRCEGKAKGCTPYEGPSGGKSIAMDTGGKNVYVASFDGNSVATFNRTDTNAQLGKLTYAGCIGATGTTHSCQKQTAGLEGPTAVTVAPNGQRVYVTTQTGHSLVELERSAGGALSPLQPGCVAGSGKPGSSFVCTTVKGLIRPFAVAVSPGSDYVYVASGRFAGSLTSFRRGIGSLSFDSCIENDPVYQESPGCPAKIPGLLQTTGVVVSRDGQYVYTSASGGVVRMFGASTTGVTLTPGACVSDKGGAVECDKSSQGLTEPRAIAVSPDDRHVYVAAKGSGDGANGADGFVTALERTQYDIGTAPTKEMVANLAGSDSGSTQVLLKCRVAPAVCRGSVEIRTASRISTRRGKRLVTLGSKAYRIAHGRQGTVRIRLTRTGAAVLASGRRVRVTVTVNVRETNRTTIAALRTLFIRTRRG